MPSSALGIDPQRPRAIAKVEDRQRSAKRRSAIDVRSTIENQRRAGERGLKSLDNRPDSLREAVGGRSLLSVRCSDADADGFGSDGRETSHEELAAARLATPHLDIRHYPILMEALLLGAARFNRMRETYGHAPTNFDPDTIRLIPTPIFATQPQFDVPGSDRETLAGFFCRYSRCTYLSFDPDRHTTAVDVYILCHELAHQSMDDMGVHDYSFVLNEGLVDTMARDLFEGTLREALGLEGDIAYSRQDEQEIVRAIRGAHRGLGERLLSCAFAGDTRGARLLIESNLGEEFSDELARKAADIADLRTLLG